MNPPVSRLLAKRYVYPPYLGIGFSWYWEFLAQAWSSRNLTLQQNPYLTLYYRFRIRALLLLIMLLDDSMTANLA